MTSLFLFFYTLIGEKGVSRVLFPLPWAPAMKQVIFVCSLEQFLDNTERVNSKTVLSSVLTWNLLSSFKKKLNCT